MDVLIAHGSEASRRELGKTLAGQGLRMVEAAAGEVALDLLLASGAPRLALVDWDLPGLEGPELCRLLRDFNLGRPPYIILLSEVGLERDITAGLQAGANDIVVLPISPRELRARVEYGRRVVELPWGASSTEDDGREAQRPAPLGLSLQTT